MVCFLFKLNNNAKELTSTFRSLILIHAYSTDKKQNMLASNLIIEKHFLYASSISFYKTRHSLMVVLEMNPVSRSTGIFLAPIILHK